MRSTTSSSERIGIPARTDAPMRFMRAEVDSRASTGRPLTFAREPRAAEADVVLLGVLGGEADVARAPRRRGGDQRLAGGGHGAGAGPLLTGRVRDHLDERVVVDLARGRDDDPRPPVARVVKG